MSGDFNGRWSLLQTLQVRSKTTLGVPGRYPTYVVDNVVHYCVANMPGAVPRTSTFALNNVTLPFVLTLAEKGYKKALEDDPHLRNGLNVHKGHVTQKEVAHDLGYEYLTMTGSTRDRQSLVDKFQNDKKYSLFLMTLN